MLLTWRGRQTQRRNPTYPPALFQPRSATQRNLRIPGSPTVCVNGREPKGISEDVLDLGARAEDPGLGRWAQPTEDVLRCQSLRGQTLLRPPWCGESEASMD
jgi:hypothetical protein